MPAKFKIMISIVVVIAAVAVFYFQSTAGHAVTPWVALALGAFMIFAMWIFPEEQKKKSSK